MTRRHAPLASQVAALLENRVVVGHALHNDLKALGISHPRDLQRDTARYPPYRKGMGNGSRPQKLAALALQYLGWRIQTGEHSPLEDAVASLRLYELKRRAWEKAGGAAAMCHDKAADKEVAPPIDAGAAGATGLAKCLGGAGAPGAPGAAARKPPKPPKPHKGPVGLAVCLGGAGVASKGVHKPKFVQGKHRWSLKPGEKKKDSHRKKGAFAGLLSAHGM